MKGFITEVCAGLTKPTARFNATSRLEGPKGRNSVVGAQRELHCTPGDFWGCSEGALVIKGGNQGQSGMLQNKHTDLTFCTLAKHSGNQSPSESG